MHAYEGMFRCFTSVKQNFCKTFLRICSRRCPLLISVAKLQVAARLNLCRFRYSSLRLRTGAKLDAQNHDFGHVTIQRTLSRAALRWFVSNVLPGKARVTSFGRRCMLDVHVFLCRLSVFSSLQAIATIIAIFFCESVNRQNQAVSASGVAACGQPLENVQCQNPGIL